MKPRQVSPAARAVDKPSDLWLRVVAGALLALAVYLVFEKSISFPFIDWDDPEYITKNSDIRVISPANLKNMFTRSYASVYVPVTVFSLALDYRAYRLNPHGYHLTNLLIHMANAVLLYALVTLLTGEWWIGLGVALIFGVHPVQPESVVWISQRKNVLSNFFFLAGFLGYARARQTGKHVFVYMAAAFLCFVLACLAKGLMVVMPVLLVVYDVCYGYFSRKEIVKYVPFFAGALLSGLLAVYFVRSNEGASAFEGYGGSYSSTFLTTLVINMKYLQLVFFPVRQSILYSLPTYTSPLQPPVVLSALGALLLAAGLFYLWKKERKLFFWGAWYFIFLLPVMVIVPARTFMQDRWLYTAIAGIFTIVFIFVKRAAGKGPLVAVMALSALAFAYLNFQRQDVWASPDKLWLSTQDVTKDQLAIPHISLGVVYMGRERWDEAIAEFQKSLEIDQVALAYSSMGIAYSKKGEYEKALDSLKKALELEPDSASTYNYLGLVYRALDKPELALENFEKSLGLQPADMQCRNNRASLLMRLGRNEEAEKELLKVLEIDPDFPEALYNLGVFYFKKGDAEKARKVWTHFLEVAPDHQQAKQVRNKLEML